MKSWGNHLHWAQLRFFPLAFELPSALTELSVSRNEPMLSTWRAALLMCLKRSGPSRVPPYHRETTTTTFMHLVNWNRGKEHRRLNSKNLHHDNRIWMYLKTSTDIREKEMKDVENFSSRNASEHVLVSKTHTWSRWRRRGPAWASPSSSQSWMTTCFSGQKNLWARMLWVAEAIFRFSINCLITAL